MVNIEPNYSVKATLSNVMELAEKGQLRNVFVVAQVFGSDDLVTADSGDWATHHLIGALSYSAHFVMGNAKVDY